MKMINDNDNDNENENKTIAQKFYEQYDQVYILNFYLIHI